MMIEMQEYLFCEDKVYYCSISYPMNTFMDFFQMDQISLFHVNVLRHDLCFPSQMFSLHHKTQCLHPLYFTQSYYNRYQILTVFMNMVQIFGVITEEFTTNDSHRGKNVPPILHIDSRIYFALSIFLSNLTNISLLFVCKDYHLLSFFKYISRKLFCLICKKKETDYHFKNMTEI